MSAKDSGALAVSARARFDAKGRRRPSPLGDPEVQYGALVSAAAGLASNVLGPFRTRDEATAVATTFSATAPDDVTITLVSRTCPGWTVDAGV